MENNIGEARRSYALTTPTGKYTQADAAHDFGVALSTYASWEQGVGKGLNGGQLREIARKYGVTTDYLLKVSDQPSRFSYEAFDISDDWTARGDASLNELVDIYDTMDDSTRAQLLDYARYLSERAS